MTAPWSPMAAPPLPLRNDALANTCPHAYPAESCNGSEWHSNFWVTWIAGPIVDPRTKVIRHVELLP